MFNQHCEHLSVVVKSLTDVPDVDEEPLPLLENQRDQFFFVKGITMRVVAPRGMFVLG